MHRTLCFWALSLCTLFSQGGEIAGIRKVYDSVIYTDPLYYSAFPSVVKRPDGELILAFRRAPERKLMGEGGSTHTDPNSQLVLIRSQDNGSTWSEPELIYAHPFGGSQDPCLLQLRSGALLCTSYAWAQINSEYAKRLTNAITIGNFAFLGGYLVRSEDNGRHWVSLNIPPTVPGEIAVDLFGKGLPAYNRGALCEGKDRRVYWAVAANARPGNLNHTGNHLLVSTSGGTNWNYSCPIATDERVVFNEASLYETPSGDLVAFIRTANFNDHTAIARSRDRGMSFGKWEDAGFKGHPHYAHKLADNRVLLVYGYRHPPFGIRARVLNEECSDIRTAPELVLRHDGGNSDLGYPWAADLSENRVLVVYYFNKGDGTRHIAGTVLEVR